MMCTAAVCPAVSSPPANPLLGFRREEDNLFPEENLARTRGEWRKTKPSRGLNALMLRFSPISGGYPVLHKPSAFRAKFDVIANLPTEISLCIFDKLDEQDLCSVCLVSKKWFSLAQDFPLRSKREAFIRSQRAHYKDSKENYRGSVYTPPAITTPSFNRTTPVLHSLNNRYTSSAPRATTTSSSSSSSDARVPSTVFDTPNNVSSVFEKLSLQGSDVRRCLFPGLESPGMKRPNCKDNLVGPSPRQREGQIVSHHMVVKKSKARLRRL